MTRTVKRVSCFILSAVMALASAGLMQTKKASADNAIVQTYYTADPSPMVVGDTMYLISSHDEDVIEGNFFTMKNWNCYSSTDMVNWTDHGTIFGQTSFEWGHISDFRAWAPQCVERDGKFYLYVPLLRKGANDEAGSPGFGIGVAVADNPAGPYEDAIGKPLIEGDWFDIDPTVFIDDDGQAYLYYGQNLKYVKLNDDMISYDTSIGDKGKESINIPNYVEGPWLTKHAGKYYFMYAGDDKGVSENHQAYETLRYAYSDSPEGPWTYGGILMETTVGHSHTNHPGVADFKGHSYLFYHTDQLKDGGGYHRSVCVSEFTYNSDGTIDLVPMVDSVDPIGTLDPYKRVEAETICYADGKDAKNLNVKTELVGTNDLRVTHLNEGDYIKIREVDFGSAGAVKFSASVAAKQDGGSFDIRLDSIEGEIIGTVDVPQTGEDVFKVVDIDVNKTTGIHDLYFTFHTVNDDDMFKFDYWQFTQDEIPVTPSPQPPAETPQPPAATAQPPVATNPPIKVKAPGKTKITKAKGAKKKATIKWKKVSGAKGYELQYSTSSKFKKAVKKISLKKTSVTVNKLKSRKIYYARVAAYSYRPDGSKIIGKYSAVVRFKVR